MNGRYELKRTSDQQFMFNLKAGNNEIILTSERYKAKESATAGIESVRANAGFDERFERRTSTNKKPYFVLKAANGEIIGTSELYDTAAAMENGIRSVKTNGGAVKLDDRTLEERKVVAKPIAVPPLAAQPLVAPPPAATPPAARPPVAPPPAAPPGTAPLGGRAVDGSM